MEREIRLKRLRFRSWHRGTKEADLMVGGFFEAHAARWSDEDIAWFEAFLEEHDVDIMAWAMGAAAVPARLQGRMMDDLKTLTYVPIQQ
ncbi:succinate dehydrogenase assembly factor 2 [Sphingomonas floccifaciens]|uniref:FAD assembly factor SdhE n=1 Tax=Sphingomonas floccifaciens TaxID=1844115 RepID=A0ABW4NGJ1_9SPHN